MVAPAMRARMCRQHMTSGQEHVPDILFALLSFQRAHGTCDPAALAMRHHMRAHACRDLSTPATPNSCGIQGTRQCSAKPWEKDSRIRCHSSSKSGNKGSNDSSSSRSRSSEGGGMPRKQPWIFSPMCCGCGGCLGISAPLPSHRRVHGGRVNLCGLIWLDA